MSTQTPRSILAPLVPESASKVTLHGWKNLGLVIQAHMLIDGVAKRRISVIGTGTTTAAILARDDFLAQLYLVNKGLERHAEKVDILVPSGWLCICVKDDPSGRKEWAHAITHRKHHAVRLLTREALRQITPDERDHVIHGYPGAGVTIMFHVTNRRPQSTILLDDESDAMCEHLLREFDSAQPSSLVAQYKDVYADA